MAEDLNAFLAKWPYDPDRTIRLIEGRDGRRKVQVRLPLGVEQYELDGRPDGERPYGCVSLLARWEARLAAHRRRSGSDEGFSIPPEGCQRLREESLLFYYRYVVLFQIGEYGRTARDTARNLRCMDLLARYAEAKEDRGAMEQYRPYIIRMNRASRALLAMRRRQYDIALREIEVGVGMIEGLPGQEEMGFAFEKRRSLAFLRDLAREVRQKRPMSLRERLEQRLRHAVKNEDYEVAAELRDRLKNLGARRAARRRDKA